MNLQEHTKTAMEISEEMYNEDTIKAANKCFVPELVIRKGLKALQEFFEEDIWCAKDEELKTEEDMRKYLQAHFSICRKSLFGESEQKGGKDE